VIGAQTRAFPVFPSPTLTTTRYDDILPPSFCGSKFVSFAALSVSLLPNSLLLLYVTLDLVVLIPVFTCFTETRQPSFLSYSFLCWVFFPHTILLILLPLPLCSCPFFSLLIGRDEKKKMCTVYARKSARSAITLLLEDAALPWGRFKLCVVGIDRGPRQNATPSQDGLESQLSG